MLVRRALTTRLLLGLAGCAGHPGTTPAPPAAPTFAESAFYAGDPHVHTSFSGDGADARTCDGCGAFTDLFAQARADGLAWIAVSDHVNGYPAASADDFVHLRDAVLAADDPEGGFVTVPAAEVWFEVGARPLGHKTLLLFGDDATLADLTLPDVQPVAGGDTEVAACDDIWRWADTLEAHFGPLLLVPHHPANLQPMPTDWQCADDTRQPLVEVYSEQGSALDDGTGFDPPWSGVAPQGTVPSALDPAGAAQRMGFIAGTDAHDTLAGDTCTIDHVRTDQPYGGGLTVVVLPEDTPLTRDTLLDALRARSVYATSGPVVPVSLAWSSGGATLGGLGADLALPPGADLAVTIQVPADDAPAVTSVELVGPTGRRSVSAAGDGTWTATVPSAEVPTYLYAALTLDGAALYGDAGCADGGPGAEEWIWTSPSWIDPG